MRTWGFALLLVLAASAVVAIGAAGAGWLFAHVPVQEDVLPAVRITAAGAAVVALAVLLIRRRQLAAAGDRETDAVGGPLLAAGKIMGALALVALMATSVDRHEPGPGGSGRGLPAGAGEGETTAGPPPSPMPRPPTDAGVRRDDDAAAEFEPNVAPLAARPRAAPERRSIDWSGLRRAGNIVLLVLLGILVVVSILALRGGLRARGRDLAAGDAVDATEAEAGLMASLYEVARHGRDPRQQITAAYGRLLLALEEAGAPRLPQDAPFEHLHRTLRPLGVRPEPMHRLTELYVAAQFSEHPITESHRAAAEEALDAGLAELRATAGASPAGASGSASSHTAARSGHGAQSAGTPPGAVTA